MRRYLALLKVDLLLAFRNRGVIFFNYLFPLVLFFVFAQLMGADRGGISYVVSMVLVLGVLGNGLFGAGMRAVQEREQNILRRFKVTPITPAALLVTSLVSGLLTYLPAMVLILGLANRLYGMPPPARPLSLLLFIALGILALRSIGLIIAAVVNSTQETSVLVQLLYMPMLFLSGVTIPMAVLPPWARQLAHFLPTSYLATGLQGVFLRNETLWDNRLAVAALLLTMGLATFVSSQLFRWEKEEKIRPAAKLWVAAVLLPFFVLGLWQLHSQEQGRRDQALWRRLQRSETVLLRGARIFVGDGRLVEAGAVLVREGRIAQVYDVPAPDLGGLHAEIVEAAGKTVLPGLIDMHVHLGAPGGFPDRPAAPQEDREGAMSRALAAYLYCGVTGIRSLGDPLGHVLDLRGRVTSGELLGAAAFTAGPLFTTEGGHGTEYFQDLPAPVREAAAKELLRLPRGAQEAREQVRALKARGVDGIKAVLESGRAGRLFERMDLQVLRAIAEEAHAQRLPLWVHTGESVDIRDALAVGAESIEHGSFRDAVPDEIFERMGQAGVAYDPTLAVMEGLAGLAAGSEELVARSLVQQAVPPGLLSGTRRALHERPRDERRAAELREALSRGQDNLLRAHRRGVLLVAGTDSGNPLAFHGPTLHRELQLWVAAGVPGTVALQAATWNAARVLRASDHIGKIAAGYDADLLVVDGDPTRDISATERISAVFYKGEQLRRASLFGK